MMVGFLYELVVWCVQEVWQMVGFVFFWCMYVEVIQCVVWFVECCDVGQCDMWYVGVFGYCVGGLMCIGVLCCVDFVWKVVCCVVFECLVGQCLVDCVVVQCGDWIWQFCVDE